MCDLLSKNLWGFIANYLRRCIHRHIIIHGDIRKITTVNVAGEEMDIPEYVEEEGEETIKMSTEALAQRGSFIRMRDDLNRRGITTRASLELSGQHDYAAMAVGMGGAKGMGGPTVNPGRVILGVTDPSSVDVFNDAFAQLPASIEVVACMGPHNVFTTCQQAAANGGFDFVLLHPEYLRDRSGSGLLAALKQNGVKIAAFGWEPSGFVNQVRNEGSKSWGSWLQGQRGWMEGRMGTGRILVSSPSRIQTLLQVIEGAQVDGYIMGPNMQGLDTNALLMLVARMQGTLNRFAINPAQMGGMTMGQGGISVRVWG